MFTELSVGMVDALKKLAEKNRRTLKAEVVLALERHLEASTKGTQATTAEQAFEGTPVGDAASAMSQGTPTLGGSSQRTLAGAGGGFAPIALPPRAITAVSTEIYGKLLDKLKDPALCALAGQLRLGVPLQQILDGSSEGETAILKKVNKIDTVLEMLLASRGTR